MRRITAVLLALLLVGVVGCSKKDDKTTDTSALAATEKAGASAGINESGTNNSTETEDVTLGEIFDMSDLPPAETKADATEAAVSGELGDDASDVTNSDGELTEPAWPFDTSEDAEPIELPIIPLP